MIGVINLKKIQDILAQIKLLDRSAMKKVEKRLDMLTKPPGSLGRLEELVVQLAGITGDYFPLAAKKMVVVMAADHGVVEEEVSAYPQEVTAQMVVNFINQGAAINVLSRLAGADVEVVDIGVATEVELEQVKKAKVRLGTANFVKEQAMSWAEAVKAVFVGISAAEQAISSGVKLLATGEMGIGNTTASSAVMAALTGYQPAQVVGRGTGLDNERLDHKINVVKKALTLHSLDPGDPVDVLSKVGVLEIAGLAGLIIGAAAARCPVVIDGFISTVAALVAVKMNPLALSYLIPSHLSQEPGHGLLLDYLGLKPYLDLDMRLGEGTGAALAMQLVEASARLLQEMATFSEAGVSDKEKEGARHG